MAFKKFGKFVSFIQTPKGFAISIISVFVLFYIISYIDKLFRWIGILFSKLKRIMLIINIILFL